MSMSSIVGAAGVLMWAAIVIVGSWGWVQNIIMLTTANFHPIGAEVIIRFIGIFVGPLGSILGLFAGHF